MEERSSVAENKFIVCDEGIGVMMWVEVEEAEEKPWNSANVDRGHVGFPLIVVQYSPSSQQSVS